MSGPKSILPQCKNLPDSPTFDLIIINLLLSICLMGGYVSPDFILFFSPGDVGEPSWPSDQSAPDPAGHRQPAVRLPTSDALNSFVRWKPVARSPSRPPRPPLSLPTTAPQTHPRPLLPVHRPAPLLQLQGGQVGHHGDPQREAPLHCAAAVPEGRPHPGAT